MQAPEVEVERFVLANGIVLLIAEQHYAQVASVQAWCQTGSIHEGRWMGAGLTHLLEHMLFKGTKKRTALQISEQIHQVGGYLNAYTSFDRTVFWIDCPNLAVPTALDLLSDLIFASTVHPGEVDREMDVIRREFEMGFDDPERLLSQYTFSTAYQVHPCRYPVIGHREIFDQIQHANLIDYYRRRYIPNNLFIVVAGDVESKAVKDRVEHLLDGVKPEPLEPIYLPDEPRQCGRRVHHGSFKSDLAYFSMSWHIPPIFSEEMPALDGLSTILGGGASAVLYDELRERQGAVYSIGAFSYTPAFPGLLTVSGSCAPDLVDSVEGRVRRAIASWRDSACQTAQLEKAKRMLFVHSVEQLQTVRGISTDVGLNWHYVKDPAFSARYLQRVSQLTKHDIIAVSDRYLSDDNLTFVTLRPEDKRRSRKPHRVRGAEPSRHRLQNGVKLLLIPDNRLPLVHTTVAFRGGVLLENRETNGSTRLHSQCLVKGTAQRTARQIANEIEALGGALFGDSGYNSFRLSASSLASDFQSALGLVSDCLKHPSFPEDVVERERESQIAEVRADSAQPMVVARNLLREAIYGGHPYGLPLLGTEASVSHLTRDTLVNLQEWCVSAEGVIAVCGQFDSAQVIGLVEQNFEDLLVRSRLGEAEVPSLRPFASRTISHRDTRHQAVISIGYLSCSLFDPDRIALELLDEATGDSSSRFFVKVREELGLAYSVGTTLSLGLWPGIFSIYAATSIDLVDSVLRLCHGELATLAANGIDEHEFERAQTKLLAQLAFQKQNMDSFAHAMALNELYGLDIDHFARRQKAIQSITLDQVREVCRKYLMDKPAITVIVKP
jgi:zinc protease